MLFVIQVSVIEGPIGEGGAWKEESVVGQILDGAKYQRVS